MLAAVQTTRAAPKLISASADSRSGGVGKKNGQKSSALKNYAAHRQIVARTSGTAFVSLENKSVSAIQSRRDAQRKRDEQFRQGAAELRVSGHSTHSSGAGEPLPMPVRQTLERSFDVNLSPVRVHTTTTAQNAAGRLSARAFTVGNNIFLGAGERANDLGLMAHETAHVVQQQGAPTVQTFSSSQGDSNEREARQSGEAVMRGENFTVRGRTGGARIQRLGVGDILDRLAELAANFPVFTLLTVIIGRNPINQRVVERSFTNILSGFMGLIPGGGILSRVLNRYGIVERLGQWVSGQLNALGLNYEYIRGRFSAFINSLGWRDIFSPSGVWRRAENIFTEPVNRIRSFISRLTSQAVTLLKETFMQPLSNFCREIPGYTLVTVLLGRDPFTGVAVAQSAINVVRAFARFIPGGTEKVNQLVESGAIQRAYSWFIQETQARNLTWAGISGTFAQARDSLRLEDVLHPIDTLRRLVNIFRPLMSDLVSFAGASLMKLLELTFEAVMGADGRRVLDILKRARATFFIIIRNPVGFLRNLLSAVGQGVRQFRTNILRHLREGVIAWLTGPVARAGIQMPERWDARGIIWFVLQILGLTWTRVRQKLVRLMGERAVGMLETGFQLIQEIRQRGLAQALRDRVTEFFGQLREAALGSIRTFIQNRLVMAGITQLLSLLNPVGAIIQAIIKTYTTINFFIQRIREILDLVESVVNSVSAIASGAVGQAANIVERTMARTIPIILDFLARFIGLGDVGGHVQRTIQGLQVRVDQMLDRAVDWIKTQAQRLGRALFGGRQSPASREINIDHSVSIGTERHTVRVQITPSGRARVLMASNGYADFRARLQRLESRYVAIFSANPATANLATQLHTEVDNLIKESETLESQASALRPPGNVDPVSSSAGALRQIYQTALQTGLNSLEQKLTSLGQHFMFGGGLNVKINEHVLILLPPPQRTALVTQVGLIRVGQDYQFGIFVQTDNTGARLPLLYNDYGTKWTATKVPIVADATNVNVMFIPSGNWRVMKAVGRPLNPSPTNPSRSINPIGLNTIAPVSKKPYNQKGHLVANRFFGPNNRLENFVAMHTSSNQSGMKVHENYVAGLIGAGPAGTGPIYMYEAQPLPVGKEPPDEMEVRITKIYPLPAGSAQTLAKVDNK